MCITKNYASEESSKMVYQHPSQVSHLLHTSKGGLGLMFTAPMEDIAVGTLVKLFAYCRTLLKCSDTPTIARV
jgi:hypothetical protein